MKILSWNCGDGFASKIDRAIALDADVAVIQEARDPALYSHHLESDQPTFWNLAPGAIKGIFVWARPGWGLMVHPDWVGDASFQQLIPLVVSPPNSDPITVWAVWARGSSTLPKELSAVGQVHGAIDALGHLLGPRTVLTGDFNSNAIWDKLRVRNHTTMVERFADKGIHSAYHQLTGEAHGHESVATQWQTRRPDWPFHIDYTFVSDDLRVENFWVGAREEWCTLKFQGGVSDHAPIMVTIS